MSETVQHTSETPGSPLPHEYADQAPDFSILADVQQVEAFTPPTFTPPTEISPFTYGQPTAETPTWTTEGVSGFGPNKTQAELEAERSERYNTQKNEALSKIPDIEPTYARGSYRETIARAKMASSERARDAIETGPFAKSPEVESAIKGYYGDHTKLAATLEFVIHNPGAPLPQAEGAEPASFESFIAGAAANELLELNANPATRQDALMAAQRISRNILLNETCVGAVTASAEDMAIITRIGQQIRRAAIQEDFAVGFSGWDESGGRYRGHNFDRDLPEAHDLEMIADIRLNDTRKFWEDTRFAGQLLFHNTGHLEAVQANGNVLTSRTGQIKKFGGFKAQTAVYRGENKAHTNVTHFSETYDWYGYKLHGSLDYGMRGTIAIPLAEVIKTAPYARNAEYGVVEFKDPKNESLVAINDDIGDIGAGGDDSQGKWGRDRVFLSDYRAENAQEAHDYDLELGASSGSDSRLLFTESEIAINANEGFQVAANPDATPAFVLPFNYNGPGKEVTMEQKEAELARLSAAIRNLQAQSRELPEFKHKIVVPLRAGVMEFRPENMRSSDYTDHYLKSVEHSIVNAENHIQREIKSPY